MTETPIFLVGATASGKSGVGMELARALGGAILCMDAMQVYRGANIGTSKPTLAERAEVPHGGLDLVEIGASFDVAQYLKHAATFLREQGAAGRRVIIVGGTGLYFRALTRGLCEAPQGSEELRAELNLLSTEELRERLGRVDPGMLGRIDGSNPRRLVRAIEVMEATGKSLLSWQEETPEPLVKEFAAFWICREKGELERRIAERVEMMFAQGWVEEVRGLVAKYGVEAVKGFSGIGYGEIGEMLLRDDATGKGSHGGLKRTEEGGREGKGGEGLDGMDGITEFVEGEDGADKAEGGAIELRGQGRSQMEFGNEEEAEVQLGNEGKGPHGGLKRTEEGGRHGKGGEGLDGITEFVEGEDGADGADGEATELRGQVRSQVQLGNEGKGREAAEGSGAGRRLPLQGVKGDILVATRQYAKRQLTWFAREPKLQKVMLTGSQPILEVVPSQL